MKAPSNMATYRIMIRNRIRVLISKCLSTPKSLPIRVAKRHRAQQCYRLITAIVTGVAVVLCYYLLFIYTRRMTARELALGDMADPYWTSDACRASSECRAHARVQYLHGLLDLNQYRIPHIIHQAAYSAEYVPVRVSYRGQQSSIAEWMHSWPDHHSTWRYLFWSWTDMQRAIHAGLPQYEDVISRVSDQQMRLDLGRYATLYLVGGVYIDLDVESIGAIPDDITMENEAFLVSEPELVSKILHERSSHPDGAIFGSRPGHPFWLRVLDAIAERIEHGACLNREDCTGPNLIAAVLSDYKLDEAPVAVLAATRFYPRIPDADRIRIRRVCQAEVGAEIENECHDFNADVTRTTSIVTDTLLGIRHGIPDGSRVMTIANIIDVIPPARLERPFDDPTQWSWWPRT